MIHPLAAIGEASAVTTLVLVLDIIAIVHLFNSSMTTERKVIWLVIILLLPVLGMILYFILHKK